MKTNKQLIDYEHKGNENHSFKLRPALLSLCMLTFIGGYSQTGKVNLNLKNVSVKELFNTIEKQTNYRFSYRDSEINKKGGVTIIANGKELKSVLAEELSRQGLSYTVSGNKIIISPAKNAVSTKEKKVSGKVTDKNGEPVIGATVIEKGTNNGTITDFEGNFILDVSQNATLEISYIGFQSQVLKAVSSKSLAVTLREDTELLDEVVVVGYGSQRKSDLTGGITSVSSEQLQMVSSNNLMDKLAGQVPGLSITSGNARPGEEQSIRIRGINSLTASNTPLIVLDGIPYNGSLGDIDPEIIENLSVLKDASSAAIYGSRGSNGVILIQTKKGNLNSATHIVRNKFKILSNNILHSILPCQKIHLLQAILLLLYWMVFLIMDHLVILTRKLLKICLF